MSNIKISVYSVLNCELPLKQVFNLEFSTNLKCQAFCNISQNPNRNPVLNFRTAVLQFLNLYSKMTILKCLLKILNIQLAVQKLLNFCLNKQDVFSNFQIDSLKFLNFELEILQFLNFLLAITTAKTGIYF